MKLGLNILSVQDEPALVSHVTRARYPAVVMYGNNAPTAYAIKKANPNTMVIVRQWPDSDLYRTVSARDFLRRSDDLSVHSCVIHGCNEAGLSNEVIEWEYELGKYAVEQGRVVCVLNPATGTYDNPDFDRANKVIRLAADFPQNVIIGLHAYAGGIGTSGLFGGNPDNAGVAPGSPGGRNLIQPENWPTRAEVDKATSFHMGRHRFLYRWCDRNGIKRPRIIVTETGFDWTGDIGTWLSSLARVDSSINGWKTLIAQWERWWGHLGWSAETAYLKQLAWADKNQFYDVEATCIFSYGYNPDWVNYSIHDTGIPAQLEKFQDAPTPPPVDPHPPPPTNADERAIIDDMLLEAGVIRDKAANLMDMANRLKELKG